MADFFDSGCDKCRAGFLSSQMPPPTRVAPHPSEPAFLYHCAICGTYWEEDAHHPVAVTEAFARKEYPNAFA
jgi:hypothetical protein